MKVVKSGLLMIVMLVMACGANAQQQDSLLMKAKQYEAVKDYDSAIIIYKTLYEKSPDNTYSDYLGLLCNAKKYKEAEKLVKSRMDAKPGPLLYIDLGNIYKAEEKKEKAQEQFNTALQQVSPDEITIQQFADAFSQTGNDEYAIKVYEEGRKKIGRPYLYSIQLANLYAKTGNLDTGLVVLLAGTPAQNITLDNAKATLLQMVGNDSAKLQQTQKLLIRKINEDPGNVYYAEILTWIYTQKNDLDGALMQIEAIDERNKEKGDRLLKFARTAVSAKQYQTATKAYDDVMAKGADQPFYTTAESEKLNAGFLQLKDNPLYKQGDVDTLTRQYDTFLNQYPKYYATQTASEYATLEAQYDNNAQKGIDILQLSLTRPDIRKDLEGAFKLQIADYDVLIGRLWDASLAYSQVDKEFKQDALGEDARFRNAKLAYYRGDFEWAQFQLSILKRATSDLIANDALYLSVLITENVVDSNLVPLQRFAYAGLLMFQNKDKEAEQLLDSIATAFPKHSLNDDILMQKAKIAEKHREYDRALGYLKVIQEKYGQDVLGDDAVFMSAEIYLNDLHQKDKAKQFYEQLVIDYPGSTYVQTARQRLQELNNGSAP